MLVTTGICSFSARATRECHAASLRDTRPHSSTGRFAPESRRATRATCSSEGRTGSAGR